MYCTGEDGNSISNSVRSSQENTEEEQVALQSQGSGEDIIPEEDGGGSSSDDGETTDVRENDETEHESLVPSPLPSPPLVAPSENTWREVTVSGGE